MVAKTFDKYPVSITIGTMVVAALSIVGAGVVVGARNTELDSKIVENKTAIERLDNRLSRCEVDSRQLDRTMTRQAADIRYIKEAVQKIELYMFRKADNDS